MTPLKQANNILSGIMALIGKLKPEHGALVVKLINALLKAKDPRRAIERATAAAMAKESYRAAAKRLP